MKRGILQAAGSTVLNTLYPRRCPICEKILTEPEELVCAACGPHLPYIREPFCRSCGRPLHDERAEYCAECTETGHLFREGRAVFRYEGRLRDALLRMKFLNRREYADFFAAAMLSHEYPFLKQIRPEVILPIPVHPRKKKERGFDQCSLLADKLSELTGLPAPKDVLVRSRYTSPQKGLGAEERRANLRGAFQVKAAGCETKSILLLDDIYTTGSTMNEAARALTEAGCRHIYFLTVCITAGREEN